MPRSERKRWLGIIGAGLALLFVTVVGALFLTGGGPLGVELPAWLPIDRATWRPEDSIHLMVRSEPEQATVILDGRARGKTPLAVRVAPGTHSLALTHPDTIDEQRQLSVSSDLSVDVALWRRRPDAMQLRPAYPGASIADATLIADGRIALTMSVPTEGAAAGAAESREAWIFDPAVGSLGPFSPEAANPRAAVLAVSPDGTRVAYLQSGPTTGPAGGRPAPMREVWVASASAAPPGRVYALPPSAGSTDDALPGAIESLSDLTWTPDGRHLLVTARLVETSAGYVAAPRSRLLLVNGALDSKSSFSDATELVVRPADVVPGSYTWAPDGRWVAFLTRANLSPGGGGFVALCAIDTGAPGAVNGFRYVANLGRQTDATRLLPVAEVARAPTSDGRLVYTAPTPRIAVTNALGLPTSSGGEPGLFRATPAGRAQRRGGTAAGRGHGTDRTILADHAGSRRSQPGRPHPFESRRQVAVGAGHRS